MKFLLEVAYLYKTMIRKTLPKHIGYTINVLNSFVRIVNILFPVLLCGLQELDRSVFKSVTLLLRAIEDVCQYDEDCFNCLARQGLVYKISILPSNKYIFF